MNKIFYSQNAWTFCSGLRPRRQSRRSKKCTFLSKTVAGIFLLFSCHAFANVAENLQARLSLFNELEANFHQQVLDANGKTLQEGNGTLKLKRPNLFVLKTQTPEENLLLSDGKTLWFYDPFVEQATARPLKDLLQQSPFVLLANNDKAQWQKYRLSQMGDEFRLTPKKTKTTVSYFTLTINEAGKLLSFSTVEKSGQKHHYLLSNQRHPDLKADSFQFQLPEGAELDDQR